MKNSCMCIAIRMATRESVMRWSYLLVGGIYFMSSMASLLLRP